MNDHLDLLDLSGIHQPHVLDAERQATLRRRVAAIVAGRESSESEEQAPSPTTVEIELHTEREASAAPNRGRAVRMVVFAASMAAAAAAIAVVVTRDEPAAPADAPRPTVTIAPAPVSVAVTTAATNVPSDPYGALTDLHVGLLDPGTYAMLDVDSQGFNVAFTVPVGWSWNGASLSRGEIDAPDGAAIYFFGGTLDVYADPCHWDDEGSNSPISDHGPAVAALLAVQPMRSATPVEDRSAGVPNGPTDRWPGRVVELSVPDDIDFTDCDGGEFRSWSAGETARSHQRPGQRDLVWAIDISGAGIVSNQGSLVMQAPVGGLVVDAASFPATPANVLSELEVILDSITVGHWG